MKINWIEEAKEYLNFLEIEDIEIKTEEEAKESLYKNDEKYNKRVEG